MSSRTSPTSLSSRTAAISVHYSCGLCKKRKIRCDRANPCSACVRAGAECIPRSRAPYPRRRKPHSGESPSNATRSSRQATDSPSNTDLQQNTEVESIETNPTASFGQ
jgi:hypothetical protein